MGHQQLCWRKFSQGLHSCCVCSNWHSLIQKYGLSRCHRCFHQYMKDIGFI
nr:40S ribosomal protein S29-like [Gorilla gorilla gorilla]